MKQHFDGAALSQMLKGMASDIAEEFKQEQAIVVLGIRHGGVPLAENLAKRLSKSFDVCLGFVDVAMYRDDLHRGLPDLAMHGTDVSFPIDDLVVVLVDDVLWSGRTTRAALAQVVDLGRPRIVRLACVIDRQEREMPLQADYCGAVLRAKTNERISVLCDKGDSNGVFVETVAKKQAIIKKNTTVKADKLKTK